MNITQGKINCAQKVVIYGPEGIGKTTFAASFPKPLFIDTEGSTKKYDVKRFDKPTSWQMLKEQVQFVINNPSLCKTLVIDTIDWAEALCIKQICDNANKKGIEDFGYGNGYVYEKEEFSRFLMLLDEVIAVNVNVVLTAHAQLRKFEQPDEMGAYDRWELKLGKKTGSQISPLVKEWADMVLFANYKTYAVATDDKGKKFKAQGGKRVMYTTHHPCWDAKNRDGLPDEVPFSFESIARLFIDFGIYKPQEAKTVEHKDFIEIVDDEPEQPDEKTPEFDVPGAGSTTETVPELSSDIPKRLLDLMTAAGITEQEVRQVVFERGFYPVETPIPNYGDDFIDGWLIPFWDKVKEYVFTKLR